MTRVLIVGCGDVGMRVARLHRDAGDTVAIVRRSGQGAEALDLDDDSPAVPVERFDIVHYHVPPPSTGDTDPRMKRLLGRLPPPARFIYLSTTAVYGDHGGAWVDETTMPSPTTARGRRRLDAERQVLEWGVEHAVRTILLRVAAIYGPGRLPDMQSGRGAIAIDPSEAMPTNRIHVDDLAAICAAAATAPDAGGVYDCADGAPCTQAEYLTELASLTGMPTPRLVDRATAMRELPESTLSFMRDGKRIRGGRLHELGVQLRYPDFRSGLRASLLSGTGS
jgi:nucleoside-diphosphate-sugar epimerase